MEAVQALNVALLVRRLRWRRATVSLLLVADAAEQDLPLVLALLQFLKFAIDN